MTECLMRQEEQFLPSLFEQVPCIVTQVKTETEPMVTYPNWVWEMEAKSLNKPELDLAVLLYPPLA